MSGLLLQVYARDRVTVDWDVSTDDAHARPYLIGPRRYATQELDIINGAARIGSVEVGVTDFPQIMGDQDSGFMTERVGDLRGRRCRLTWQLDASEVVLVDGPAGVARMDDSYAAYRWAIKDVRDVERSIPAFNTNGRLGLVPRQLMGSAHYLAPIVDWGNKGDDTFLLDALAPAIGIYEVTAVGALGYFATISLDSYWDDDVVDPLVVVSDKVEAVLKGQVLNGLTVWRNVDVLWRQRPFEGEPGPWNVARPALPGYFGSTSIASVQDATLADTTAVRAVKSVTVWQGAETPSDFDDLGTGSIVEVILRHRGECSEDFPGYFEGTAGALITALYDGDLARPPELGGTFYDPAGLEALNELLIKPVRYDAAALALMTLGTLVRQTASISDAREWAEKSVYMPAGFAPALDDQGRISPVSRVLPSPVTGPAISNLIAEPSPNWDQGETVVTSVAYQYPRYFIPASSIIARLVDGLAEHIITVEFEDVDAQAIEPGNNPATFDATIFGAIGDSTGDARAGVGPEAGDYLAQDARYEILARFRLGAPAIAVAVRRTAAPSLRVGDWSPVDLSWFPNTDTGRRQLQWDAGQVISIDEQDPVWRTLLVERSTLVASPGFFSAPERFADDASPGFMDGPIVLTDEVES